VCVTVNVDCPADRPPAPIDMERAGELIRRHYRQSGLPLCRKCGWPCSAGDAGIVRRRMCSTCEARWLDGILERLIDRHGRKGAVAALKALAPKSK
jgi:hypothetical protein